MWVDYIGERRPLKVWEKKKSDSPSEFFVQGFFSCSLFLYSHWPLSPCINDSHTDWSSAPDSGDDILL
jgi:hypothetical protein